MKINLLKKNTFEIDNFITFAPILGFINENKCIKISFKFAQLFHVCDILKNPSYKTIFLDEEFKLIEFYNFKVGSLKDRFLWIGRTV